VIHRSPLSNFHLFVTKLETIIKNYTKLDIQIIFCGDINTNYLVESNKKINAMLHSCNLHSVVYFPTRTTNRSSTMVDNFLFNNILKIYTFSNI
jgi:hypothetical protein